jgi:CO/xanthine dehydrogenase FAD-binding subunit
MKRERMIVTQPNYFAPDNLSNALILLSKWKEKATLIAGGTNVIPDMRGHVIRPQAIIDLSRVKNLSYVKEEKQKIRIGALTTISQLISSEAIKKYTPILYEAGRQIGNPLVRNRATMAGNLADASPAADSAVPLLVLEAVVVVERQKAKARQVPVDRFFVGPNRTVLRNDELVREIIIPKPSSSARMAYSKFGLRNAMAISVASVGVLIETEKGRVKKARVGLGAVAPTPIRAFALEEILMDHEVTEDLIVKCGRKVEEVIRPITDIRGSLEYRRTLAAAILKRLLRHVSGRERV